MCYACGGEGDFACDEVFASAWAFVVEEYAVGGIHSVAFAVVLHNPEGVHFGYGVGRARIEWCVFVLGYLAYFAEEFAGGGLVYAALFFEAEYAYCFEQSA